MSFAAKQQQKNAAADLWLYIYFPLLLAGLFPSLWEHPRGITASLFSKRLGAHLFWNFLHSWTRAGTVRDTSRTPWSSAPWGAGWQPERRAWRRTSTETLRTWWVSPPSPLYLPAHVCSKAWQSAHSCCCCTVISREIITRSILCASPSPL